MTPRISAAIAATRRLAPGYFEKCLAQRCGGAGSSYTLSPEALEQALQGAAWEPYEHPNVMKGCSAFRAPLVGTFGLIALASVPEDARVVLADPKGTGFVEAECAGAQAETVGFSVIILGEEQGEEIVFTFHPGDPIQPSRLPAEGRVGQVVTAKEARDLGFTWAKVAAP